MALAQNKLPSSDVALFLRFRRLVAGLLLFALSCLFVGCTGNVKEANDNTTKENEVATGLQLEKHYSPAVISATLAIKDKFEAGLRNHGGANRELAYLYQQNSRLLRSHYLAEETFRFVFPFNGAFSLDQVEELVGQLPYMTNKCGYQAGDGTIVQYYCPSLDSTYFRYLAEITPSSPLISEFQTTYQAQRTISSELRQRMLVSGPEELEFTNPDHQLFYVLFQMWAYADMRAQLEIRDN